MKQSPWGNSPDEKPSQVQIIADLARTAQQELDAITDYKERAKSAELAGDKETVKLYEHIIPQEEEHFQEVIKRMRELGVEV